jgi:hypothetical protein
MVNKMMKVWLAVGSIKESFFCTLGFRSCLTYVTQPTYAIGPTLELQRFVAVLKKARQKRGARRDLFQKLRDAPGTGILPEALCQRPDASAGDVINQLVLGWCGQRQFYAIGHVDVIAVRVPPSPSRLLAPSAARGAQR